MIEPASVPDSLTRSTALPRRPHVARWWFVPLAGACVALGFVLTQRRPEEPPVAASPLRADGERLDIAQGAPTWRYVELVQAALGPAVPPAPVPGRVAVDEARSTSVVAPLPGRVDAVAVRLGERVQQGDRLLAVRSTALVDLFREIDLMHAKEAARAKAVERLRDLVRLKATPEKDLVAAEQELRQTQLAREAAELKLKSLSLAAGNEGLYWITAPRHGVVVERNVLVGQEVGPDRSEALLQVAELDEVIVTADVPEADVLGLQVGQHAVISSAAAPDRELTGLVENVAEVVDPLRHMVNVRVRVPNTDHILRPNAFVQVAFTADGQQRVLADAEAVVTDDQRSYVFVQPAGRPGSLERRAVVTGRQSEGKVEILKGLEPGETYVAKGAILLLNAMDLAQ